MQNLKIGGEQDRSKINMHEPHEVQYWSRHLKISSEQLQKLMEQQRRRGPEGVGRLGRQVARIGLALQRRGLRRRFPGYLLPSGTILILINCRVYQEAAHER